MARRMSIQPCIIPGCPVLTNEPRCSKHQTKRDRKFKRKERGTSASRGYGSQWVRKRKRFLDHHAPRDSFGRVICQACRLPISGSPQVDHKIRRADGGSDDPSNLQALHRSCHGRKTASKDGGFGNPKR